MLKFNPNDPGDTPFKLQRALQILAICEVKAIEIK